MKARTISKALSANRARLFVGRDSEIAAFDRLISGDRRARVYLVRDPAAIGKTTLLRALAARAIGAGLAVSHCDARDLPADPTIVRAALDAALGRAGASGAGASLLTIDAFEEWAAIEGWFRDEYLATLPP